MASYDRFEDLPVWQTAIKLAEGCEDFLVLARDRITWSKRDQLDRCSLSVSNNIAEGFERGSTSELLAFLYIARGSAGETRSMLAYFERRPALVDFKSQISNLKSLAENCSRQLRAWADSLQNSEIKGQRHLNSRSREDYRKRKDAEVRRKTFEEMERAMMSRFSPDHPLRREYERKNGPLDDAKGEQGPQL
ncbi:four helix bundle protein [Haloferula sp. BvORR071]|uniref:four helix bundle protein n=1 Tax=Haloferula sp. BvORR071 TaxID=1396141 RepID=UPI0006990B69|nr:four helix bundle protein [Haloferula sp. BvORR071]